MITTLSEPSYTGWHIVTACVATLLFTLLMVSIVSGSQRLFKIDTAGAATSTADHAEIVKPVTKDQQDDEQDTDSDDDNDDVDKEEGQRIDGVTVPLSATSGKTDWKMVHQCRDRMNRL